MDKQELDLESLLANEFGASVKSVNPDGSAQIAMLDEKGNEIEKRFDTLQFVKDQGADPMKLNIKYNSPESALDDNPVGFATSLKMSLADPKKQLEMLQEDYGASNVVQSEDGIKVKDNGVWKKADPGWFSELVSRAPEIVIGYGGATAGAALGTMVMPGVGTFVGGVLGGALGGSLATVVKNEGVEALNIRTEEDGQAALETFGKEMVNNLIWGSALGVAGKVAGTGAKYTSGVVKRVFNTFADKATLSEAAEKWMPGTSKVDWGTVVRSSDDAKAVVKDMDKVLAHSQKSAVGQASGADPATKEMVETMASSMKGFKEAAFKQYDEVISTLENSGALSQAKVGAAPAATDFKREMISLGLVEKVTDGVMKWNPKPGSAADKEITQIFDAKSVRTLKSVFEQLEGVVRLNKGELKWQQSKQLLNGIDDILESSGYYKGGDAAISSRARVALIKLRGDLSGAASDSLKPFNIVKDGKQLNASQYYRDGASKYHQFREVYDQFALPSQFGGDSRQVVNTVERMLGEKGFALEESFNKLSGAVGKKAEPVLTRLQQLRAAKNLSDAYASQTGGTAILKNMALGGPRDTAKFLANRTIQAEQKQQLRRLPISSATKTLIGARARAVDFLNSRTGEEMMTLISNPMALRQLYQVVEGAPQIQQQTSQELIGQ